jgi:hypothetical protein
MFQPFQTAKENYAIVNQREKKVLVWKSVFFSLFIFNGVMMTFLLPYDIFVKVLPLHHYPFLIGILFFLAINGVLYFYDSFLKEKTWWVLLLACDLFFCLMFYNRALLHSADLYILFFGALPLTINIIVCSVFLTRTVQFLEFLLQAMVIVLFQSFVHMFFTIETFLFLFFLLFLYVLFASFFHFLFFTMKKENTLMTEMKKRKLELSSENIMLRTQREQQHETLHALVSSLAAFENGETCMRVHTQQTEYADAYSLLNRILSRYEQLAQRSQELKKVQESATVLAEKVHLRDHLGIDIALPKTKTCLDPLISVLNKKTTDDLFII